MTFSQEDWAMSDGCPFRSTNVPFSKEEETFLLTTITSFTSEPALPSVLTHMQHSYQNQIQYYQYQFHHYHDPTTSKKETQTQKHNLHCTSFCNNITFYPSYIHILPTKHNLTLLRHCTYIFFQEIPPF